MTTRGQRWRVRRLRHSVAHRDSGRHRQLPTPISGSSRLQRQQPGTGTPGYWKNHPEAWPVHGITVGGITYTKAQAIAWLGKVGKDKTTTMFSSLVPAMLNVCIGNDGSCVTSTIAAANTWMATYGPVGSNVAASSYAWTHGRTAAPADGRLQQRTALRPASQLIPVARWPFRRVTGPHRRRRRRLEILLCGLCGLCVPRSVIRTRCR